MLVSYGSWNKLPQTRGLKTTDSYSLSVLEVRNLKTRRVGMAVLPLKALGEELRCLSQLLVAPGIPWLWHHNSSFCLHLPRVFNPSPSVSVLCLTQMPVMGIRGCLNPE